MTSDDNRTGSVSGAVGPDLAVARQQVAEARKRVARQRLSVHDAIRQGRPAERSVRLLTQFEALLFLFEKILGRLEAQAAAERAPRA